MTFLWLSDPFRWLSDLQLRDKKVTLNHLVPAILQGSEIPKKNTKNRPGGWNWTPWEGLGIQKGQIFLGNLDRTLSGKLLRCWKGTIFMEVDCSKMISDVIFLCFENWSKTLKIEGFETCLNHCKVFQSYLVRIGVWTHKHLLRGPKKVFGELETTLCHFLTVNYNAL